MLVAVIRAVSLALLRSISGSTFLFLLIAVAAASGIAGYERARSRKPEGSESGSRPTAIKGKPTGRQQAMIMAGWLVAAGIVGYVASLFVGQLGWLIAFCMGYFPMRQASRWDSDDA